VSNAVTVLAVDLMVMGGDFEKRLNRASGAVAQTANRFDQFNKASQKAAYRGNEVGAAMESLTAKMFLVQGSVGIAVSGFVAFEAALIKIAVASTQAFAGFDATMTRVESITGETAAGMAMLQKEVSRLNETSPLTGQQLAGGLEMLAMGGLKATDAMIALEPTQKLAVVGNLEMAQSADIVTNAINQFGVGAAGLQGILDMMAVAVTNSNTNLAQLGTALNYSAGAATGAGLEINETVGALAAFANVGYKASMGGTALRGTITRLLDPTKKAQGAMDSMSLTVKDAAGQMLPLSNILEQLVYKQATTAEIFTIFGQRAGGAIAALVAGGYQSVDMLKGLEDATSNAGGALDKMFGTQQQSLENRIKAAESAFENLKIKIGSALEPAVGALADSLQVLFTNLSNAGGLVDAVGMGVAALVTGFNLVTYAIHAAATVVAVLNMGVVLLEAAVRVLAGGLGTIVGLLLVLASPLLVIVDLVRGMGSEMPLASGAVDLLSASFGTLTGTLGFLSDESDKADAAMGSLKDGLSGARGQADGALTAFVRLNNQLKDQEAARGLGQTFTVMADLLVLGANRVEEAWTNALANPANKGLQAINTFGKQYVKGWQDLLAPLFGDAAAPRGTDASRKPIPTDGAGGGNAASAIASAMMKVEKATDKANNALEKLAKDEEKRQEAISKAMSKAMAEREDATELAKKEALARAKQMQAELDWRAALNHQQHPNEIYRTAAFTQGLGQGFNGVSAGVTDQAAKLTKQDETRYLEQQLVIEDSLIEKERIRNQLLAERLRMGNEHLRQVADGAQATFAAIGQEIQLVGTLADKNSTQKEVTAATVGLMSNLGSTAKTAMDMFGVSAEKSLRVQAILNTVMAVTALGMGLMAAPTNPVAAGSYFMAAATLAGQSIGGFIGASMAGNAQSEFVSPVSDASARENDKRDMEAAFTAALKSVGLDELAKRDISNNYYLYDPVSADRQENQARRISRQVEKAKARTL
jgi:TP901 family phage tail tape measure protein